MRSGDVESFAELRRTREDEVVEWVRLLTATEADARVLAARSFDLTLRRLTAGGGPRRDLVSYVVATARYLLSKKDDLADQD
ncbi:hypothetical protein UK23_14695 [Lentzea aerocolonigenes]|uniref:Uncharacterized protein n=1 Tax=Lentzea aerocolonigenes TaxID=68170 RepID=A0A0F0H2X1_LENAE|nr:hypothetical protein [Lentzea aerocolonigenes]KJK49226.1 hypothetical protein UK23_14695 [Lentzea aerocolonigenes]